MSEYEWVVETRNSFEEPQPVSTVGSYVEALFDVAKYAELAGVALKPSSVPDEWFLQVPHLYNKRITITKVEVVKVRVER